MADLKWKLLTRKRASSTQGVPPGKEDLAWVTNTVTLVYGQRDAVLADTFLSEQHSKELLDWVVESGKNLRTIYVTHAHGDHFLGLKLLLDKFANHGTHTLLPAQRPHGGPNHMPCVQQLQNNVAPHKAGASGDKNCAHPDVGFSQVPIAKSTAGLWREQVGQPHAMQHFSADTVNHREPSEVF